MNDFLSSLKIAATGLHAQTARMRIIAGRHRGRVLAAYAGLPRV